MYSETGDGRSWGRSRLGLMIAAPLVTTLSPKGGDKCHLRASGVLLENNFVFVALDSMVVGTAIGLLIMNISPIFIGASLAFARPWSISL